MNGRTHRRPVDEPRGQGQRGVARVQLSPGCLLRPVAVVAALIGTVGITADTLADRVLETAGGSLTSVLFTGSTTVQGVRPAHQQRGVGLDGSFRAGAALPLALSGSPFPERWNGMGRLGSLRLDTGSYTPTDVDIALPAAGFPWVVGRTYNGVQLTSGGSHQDSDGYQGKNWFQTSQPEMAVYVNSGDHTQDTAYIVYGGDRYIEFLRTGASSTEYKGKNGAAGVVQYSAGSPDTWTYTDQHGNQAVFFGSNTSSNRANWQLWKMTDPAGNVAYVGDASTASTAVTSGYDSTGHMTTAYDPTDRRYTYTYTTLDSVSRLTQVKAETKTGGTWSSPSGLATVAQVDYDYYQTGSNAEGDNGNLKLVTVTTPLTDSGVNLVQKKHYRYWKGAYDASTNPGNANTIKLVVGFEGYRAYDWDQDSTLDDDPLGATTTNLKAYGEAYFEYESGYKVRAAFFNGECGCSGGNNGTYNITYGSSSSHSTYVGNGSYDTGWDSRAVVQQPDGTYFTQYFDELGQPISRAVTDSDPAGSPTKLWATQVTRNSDGQITEIDWPSNITAYNHSTPGFTSSSSAGLISIFTRETGNVDLKGYILEEKFKDAGSAGSAYYARLWTNGNYTKTVGAVGVLRPLRATDKTYTDKGTSSGGTAITTTLTNTAAGGSSTLMHKEVDSALPSVSTGNNGSGSATTTSVFYRTDGTPVFRASASGVYDYMVYTNGQLTTYRKDVLLSDTYPSGEDPNTNFGITENSDGLDVATTYAYDAQGRPDTTTLPDGRVTKMYYSKLADGRMVTISWPRKVSTTYYGPASYTVTNHAGKATFTGMVAISSSGTTNAPSTFVDETDSDAITALDVGTLARMSTAITNSAGTRVEEARAYHTIPGSGAGSSGTNYDATKYGFDDMGRTRRVKAADGTIRRTNFDELGRPKETYIGTNDHDAAYPGGETAGTADMVKDSATEYDGGSDKGNSYVTARTAYIQGSSTGQRVTTYLNDGRGRAVVVLPPTAPYVLNLIDNAGRTTAVGLYSSTSGLDATDDATALATNRMALSKTFFDERGMVWKSQRHKIDASDGSDDDNLQTLNWYDPDGRMIKTRGSAYMKVAFDRLGRVTDRYALAVDDDAASTYTDVYDSSTKAVKVNGDTVMEQDETAYESVDSDNVLMTVHVGRHHDDLGNGTTGALDSGADADRMVVTAANVKGRVAITALWYDDLDRVIDTVAYGTNAIVGDGSTSTGTFTRTALSAPTRSDTELRTTTTYNDDGTVLEVADPRNLKTRWTYDALGRKTAQTSNYVNGTPSGSPDYERCVDDNIVRYTYSAGHMTEMWVDFDGDNVKDTSAPKDQVTTYTFGVAKGASAGDSLIGHGGLLWKVTYPDSSSGTDLVTFAYNAQGQVIWKKDQAGNILETTYDDSGRVTLLAATTVAGGFDTAVKSIATAYDTLGRVDTVTQYDNAVPASGSPTDQTQDAYDSWGNISTFTQDPDGIIGAGGRAAFSVTHTWTKATNGRYTLRQSSASLIGQTVTYNYASSNNSLGDKMSRVTSISVGNPTGASYVYTGQATVVGTTLDQAAVYRRMYATPATTGVYPGLDRFDRVVSDIWVKDLATDEEFDKRDIAYDRDSNITRVEDGIHTTGVAGAGNGLFDVAYTMDDRNRLTRAYRGNWNGSVINNATADERWTDGSGNAGLSQTGNWARWGSDINGNGTFSDTGDLDETRTHNTANEITGRDTDSNASNNYVPVYDAVGNLTDDNQNHKYVYDVLGRVRQVKNQSSTLVAEYWYNGLSMRIALKYDNDTDGDVDGSDKKYWFAYDEGWRLVGTYRETDSDPKERFIPHQAGLDGRGGSSYIDDVVLRDKDSNTAWTSASDGVLEERINYCQNWRHDVSAEVTSAGKLREWVMYTAYGEVFCSPAGDVDRDGDYDATDAGNMTGPLDPGKDADLSGAVDSADVTYASSITGGYQTLGRGVLSSTGVANRKGYAGYEGLTELAGRKWLARNRVLDSVLGAWTRRDPLGDIDGANLYEYVANAPLMTTDSMGLKPDDWDLGWDSGGSFGDSGGSFGVGVIPLPFPGELPIDWEEVPCPIFNPAFRAIERDCKMSCSAIDPTGSRHAELSCFRSKLHIGPINFVCICPFNKSQCTPAQDATYEAAVRTACKNPARPFSCKWTDDCDVLATKIQNAQACLSARQSRDNTCWGGGDFDHVKQRQAVNRALSKCVVIYASKCLFRSAHD